MRQHGEHALDAHGRAGVDARDAALGDRRADDAAMGQAGNVELGGIFCGAGDFRDSVDAGCGGADVRCHGCAHAIFLLDCDCGVPRAACESARTMVRRARSILNVLCPKPLASRSTNVGRLGKRRLVGRLAAQRGFGLCLAPGLVRDAAERKARFLDGAAIELEADGDGHQRKRIGQPVADLEVGVVRGKAARRQLDRRDQFVGAEVGVVLRRVAGQPVKVRERNLALAARAGHVNLRLQHGQRDAHVRRMHRDAGFARAEDGVHAVEAADGRAARAGLAFVAGRRNVVEVGAARALQEVAADRRHVAQLLRGAGQQRARQHRIAPLHHWVIGKIGVAHERPDAKAAACGLLDLVERKPGDVDQLRRPLDVHLHQVDQIGAAGDEFRPRARGHLAHGVGDIRRTRILEVDHDCPIACWIAATMLVYAPQRQMLPLISSRICSGVFALPSAISPAAEQIWPGVQ